MADSQNALLTEAQIESFLPKHGLNRSMVVLRENGFHRDALIALDRVFIFPRTAGYAASMRLEMQFLRAFSDRAGVPAPKVLGCLDFPGIPGGAVGVFSRLPGENWEDLQEQLSWPVMKAALLEMAEFAPAWHALPLSLISDRINPAELHPFSDWPVLQGWLIDSLRPESSVTAVRTLQRRMIDAGLKWDVAVDDIAADAVLDRWIKAVGELAALGSVILHGDMHEGQLLLDPSRSRPICGILDWEAVQIGNPIIDFSFHKWGWGKIWEYREHFPQMRRELWSRYLAARRITNVSPESLQFYCALTEIQRTLVEFDLKLRPTATVTRKPHPASFAEQLDTLRRAADSLS